MSVRVAVAERTSDGTGPCCTWFRRACESVRVSVRVRISVSVGASAYGNNSRVGSSVCAILEVFARSAAVGGNLH